MIEVTGDLWGYPVAYRCITTNGFVKKDGSCVMGRGCAKEATERYPGIEFDLGKLITKYGNIVMKPRDGLYTFPVKHKWWEKADLNLIKQSTAQLFYILQDKVECVIPRPGCGNGGLKWDDVKPILKDLPDNYKVITYD